MVLFLLSILLIVFVIAIFEERLNDEKIYVYIVVGIILVLCAGCKKIGFDNDSENYEYIFHHYDDSFIELAVEHSFLLLCRFFNFFTDDVHIMFFLYSGLGIFLKMTAIKRLSELWFLPLTIYIGNVYLVQDLTQIRACVASGLFLLSLKPIADGEKKIAFSLVVLGAIFHVSALILLPIIFLKNETMTPKYRIIWASIVPIGYLFYFMNVNLFTQVHIPYISEKIEYYEVLRDKGLLQNDEINVFNLVYLVRCFVYFYILYFYETISQYSKYVTLMLKIMGISIASFTFFAFLPAVAFRISELYGVVEIFVFSFVSYTIKPNWLARGIVAVIGFVLFFINAYVNVILHP